MASKGGAGPQQANGTGQLLCTAHLWHLRRLPGSAPHDPLKKANAHCPLRNSHRPLHGAVLSGSSRVCGPIPGYLRGATRPAVGWCVAHGRAALPEPRGVDGRRGRRGVHRVRRRRRRCKHPTRRLAAHAAHAVALRPAFEKGGRDAERGGARRGTLTLPIPPRHHQPVARPAPAAALDAAVRFARVQLLLRLGRQLDEQQLQQLGRGRAAVVELVPLALGRRPSGLLGLLCLSPQSRFA